MRVLDTSITNGSRMIQTSALEAHDMANGTMTKKAGESTLGGCH